ncbi:MAG: phosphate ABC transporter substrate-binding protein PstS [Bdellovibrionales bacterium RIFOXYD12_FULL_39_22]|nr:MAG: phosphate ABC transporter substrate-binding protein PstS [Bdellovibrionales bacterium RIFOXYB1_FULL_39_21]OFZ42043.1 MAG: phosphate ABC transporter substrate-binding protein PstS [Bdellovibrionales bacterium RIFOXYC12_FULL_39_17]OFZ50759.1 MAG: phosphate ABC transporter substrate-binding protein PstS [Bdellovibrionales bacterium RIFOXYC1_FULL_39_130]OFZ77982.1 MAG: phosphate ABC transporter substrate-binding protein PstS [Bdellovibrionales bacterium RIFOXYD1_FULL_39_84]OFZ93582.1 MAG: p
MFRNLTLTILMVMSLMVVSAWAKNVSITGAGATFPYPIYSKWFSEFQKIHPDAQIDYQSIGSGGGIRQFAEGTIDFGATDAPMTDEQNAKVSALHIPTVMGAVVVTYNLKGVATGLKLTGSIVADIFLGKITKWNDPKILEINPGLKLPDLAIMVAHRSDGSGTTGIFTDYLVKVSASWKEKVGHGTAVNWPAGLGGKGNEGVTGLVKQTPGSIGYVELIYAENNKLPYATIKNKAGIFVDPSMKSVSAAAAASLKTMPEDFRISITDAESKDAYPISGFTYLLVHPKMEGAKGKTLVKFLEWAISDGQKYAEELFYAPLPKEMIGKVEKSIKSIQVK